MGKYKAIARGYDNEKIREIGEEFDFDGVPGKWMDPVDAEAKKAFTEMKSKKHLRASKAKDDSSEDGELAAAHIEVSESKEKHSEDKHVTHKKAHNK